MTKLSFSFALATLTVSLAAPAHAYSVAPEADPYEVSVVERVNVLFGAAKQSHEGICELTVTPVLADALGISTPVNSAETVIALASCEPE